MTVALTRNGTDGRVYGGDCALVHIGDGQRQRAGEAIAEFIDAQMRQNARLRAKPADGLLCPGCFMIAVFNAAIYLADWNGQPRTELGNTLAAAFARLAANPEAAFTEEINVIVDPD
jgi:hypothetical protein